MLSRKKALTQVTFTRRPGGAKRASLLATRSQYPRPFCRERRRRRGGRGRAGRAPARGAPLSWSRPSGRRARSPLAFVGRCARLQEKPAPRAPAVRNPVVTIVITAFILNDSDHYHVFTFLTCKMLNSGI